LQGRRVLRKIQLYFVHKAPTPVLAPFQGTHDWMFSLVEVFGGVLVLRRVATADMTADHAKAKVNPLIAHFETLFAAFGMGLDVLDLIQMCTLAHTRLSPMMDDLASGAGGVFRPHSGCVNPGCLSH
jgi:hypothetical protein